MLLSQSVLQGVVRCTRKEGGKVHVPVEIVNLAADLPLPQYQTEGSAGMDLRAAIPHDKPEVLEPGEYRLIPCGIKIALPPGYEAQVRSRSGLALKHGIVMHHGVGTIDADYRGEVGAVLANRHKWQNFVIRRGDRIAQLIVSAVARATLIVADTLPETGRGAGGFGSTGK